MLETNTLPYFAYGSNMSVEQMAERCPGSTAIGLAELRGHRFIMNRCGYATVEAVAGSQAATTDAEAGDIGDVEAGAAVVMGVLWQVTDEHLASQDRYEGVAEGRYLREEVTLSRLEPGGAKVDIQAILYRDPITEAGPPNPGYLERVIDGAVVHDVDPAYVDQVLRSFF